MSEQAEKLITDFGNASYDCGEWGDDRSSAYAAVLKPWEDAKAALKGHIDSLEAQLAEARQQNEKLKAARAEAITGFVAAQNTLREVRERCDYSNDVASRLGAEYMDC